jgi:hypothetical protein
MLPFMDPAPYASARTILDGMEEREQRLEQAMVDQEDWAAGLRAHYDGIRWDVDAERMSLLHEWQELLNLQA